MTEEELRQRIQQILLQYMCAIHAELIHSHDDVFLTDRILTLVVRFLKDHKILIHYPLEGQVRITFQFPKEEWVAFTGEEIV